MAMVLVAHGQEAKWPVEGYWAPCSLAYAQDVDLDLIRTCMRDLSERPVSISLATHGGGVPRGARYGTMLRLIIGLGGFPRLLLHSGSIPIPQGMVVLCAPGAWFVPQGRGRFLNLAIRDHGIDLRLRSVEGKTTHTLAHGMIAKVDRTLHLAFATIESLLEENDPATCSAAVNVVLQRLQRRLHAADFKPFIEVATPWLRIVDAIRERLGGPIDRSSIARDLTWHPGHVSRVCRDQGETFTHVVQRLRLERAEELLVKTNLDVQDIAMGVGFTSAQYFVRCFRARWKETPGRWRQLRQGQKNRPRR